MKYVVGVFGFFLTFMLAAATVEIEPGTPVFARPDFASPVLGVTNQLTVLEKTGEKLHLAVRHPLAGYTRFDEIKLGDGSTAYVNRGAMVTAEGKLQQGNPVEAWRNMLLAVLVGLLAMAIAVWVQRHKYPQMQPYAYLALAAIPVLVRQIGLLWLVNRAQNILTAAADENGYYQNLISFLTGDYSVPMHYTVGTSLLYWPFERLWGTGNLNDIFIQISYFEGFVIAPGCLLLGFLIGRKLGLSDKRCLAAMLLWAVLPFVFHHRPDFVNRVFCSFFEYPDWSFSFRHYVTLIGCGFTAMSDAPSTFCVLLVMTVVLYGRASYLTAALAALIFAFGCMLRINNILFVPAIAALAWFYQPGYRRILWRSLGAGAVAFVIGFLPQFWVNSKFFGNPLQFSYTNYANGAHTYLSWEFVGLNSAYYGNVNLLVWIFGLSALFAMRDRMLRLILSLWAIPVILFFFAYSHGSDDPVRFIMTSYPAFFLAVAAVWRDEVKERIPSLLFLAGLILVIPNITWGKYDFYYSAPWRLLWRNGNFGALDMLGVLLLAGATLWFWRLDRRAAGYLVAVAVLYVLGNSYLLALGLFLMLIYAFYQSRTLFGKTL